MKLFLSLLLIAGQVYAEGLKKVDFENKTTESQTRAMPEGESITPEQQKEMLKNIETIKANQAESAKVLEELDKDE